MNYARACNLLLDTALPEWIQLLPVGPNITGADGRAWRLDDPHTLIRAFQQRATPLVIDWEHASEHRAPQGLDAPAAGWIHQLDVREGSLWGHVEWTARAVQQLQDREYRYLSPVFTYHKDTRQIVALTSVALTNQPNLDLKALNREESPMSLNALCVELALPETADEAQLLTAVRTLKTQRDTAQNRTEMPPLEKFIPRADYDAVLARATNAEQKLAEVEAVQRQATVDALIGAALQAYKITPATQDYYAAMCQTQGGIAAFQAFLDKAPPILGAESGLDGKPTPQSKALNRAAFDLLDPPARYVFLTDGGKVTD